MSENSPSRTRRRSPVLAAILSLLTAGLGQVYCGRLVRGLVFITFVTAVTPAYFLILTRQTPPTTAALATVLILYGVTWLVPPIDALWIACRTRRDYPLKEYNRLTVYLLLWVINAGSAMGYALHARSVHVEAFRVPAASMYPTFVPNDRFLANKTVYESTDPQPGDLVIFKSPTQRRQNWVKRVIALAGDTVEIREGRVRVNGQALAREAVPDGSLVPIVTRHLGGTRKGQIIDGAVYEEHNGGRSYRILHTRGNGSSPADFAETTVPAHHCFVLGDNRDNSVDSRHHGSIPLATIIGRADYLYCPAKSWSRFGPLE